MAYVRLKLLALVVQLAHGGQLGPLLVLEEGVVEHLHKKM
jgi:hypothetical protein